MRFLSYLFVGALLLSLYGCSKQQPVQAKQEPGPIAIEVAPVVVRQVQRIVESVGTLFPYDESVISAEIDGRVDQVKVDLGDRVAAGAVMVHIADEEQRYLLTQNEAQLRQSLERLGLKDENERIADIKATPDIRRAQADLTDAEQRYARAKSLTQQSIGSRQDLDAAEAHYHAMHATY